MIKKLFRQTAPYMKAMMCGAACVIVLMHSEEAAEAVARGIRMCVTSVMPSLFPMIFLSQYMIKSGAAGEAGQLLNRPAKALLGLPGVCGVALLTGLIGGYPAGARAAESLVQSGEISREDGERLANIAFCSGPGFTLGWIGGGLYKNKMSGLLILTAQAVSCIIIGIVWNIVRAPRRINARRSDSPIPVKSRVRRQTDAFVESAADTASTMLAMSSFIVLFQVFIAMLDAVNVTRGATVVLAAIGLEEYGRYLMPCLMEVTTGSVLSVNLGLPFTAFVVGFGGLSVHFQNFAICRRIRPDQRKYWALRTVQGVICSLIVSAALRMPYLAAVCRPATAMIDSEVPAQFSHISYSFGAVMLVMCLMSVVCLPARKEQMNQ